MPRHGGKREGAGRKPGVPNKLTTDIKGMILGALSDVGGREYLARQANENPSAFLTLVGKVLPMQLANAQDASSLTFLHLVAVRAFTEQLNSTVINGHAVAHETTDDATPPDLMAPALE